METKTETSNKPKAIALVSGGLDSVTLAYLLASEGWELHLLAYDYGQRHQREVEFARQCAQDLGAAFDLVDLRGAGQLLGGSALTDENIAVPHGHYAAPSMAITIVPNRNAIFLAVAYGAAVAENAQIVATAVHGGDHFIYPDCRPGFIEAFDAMQKQAVAGCGHPDFASARAICPSVQTRHCKNRCRIRRALRKNVVLLRRRCSSLRPMRNVRGKKRIFRAGRRERPNFVFLDETVGRRQKENQNATGEL